MGNYNLGRDDCFRCKTKKSRTAGEVCAALLDLSSPAVKYGEGQTENKKPETQTAAKAETPKTPEKAETPKTPKKRVSTRNSITRRNSLRTVTPVKKSDLPCWE